MFKKLVKKHINHLKWYLDKLERAYEETYAETSKEFNKHLEKLRESNKRKFIEDSGEWLNYHIKKQNGLDVPKGIRRMFGEKMFEIAQEKGDLDEFNNLKEER